MYRTLMVCVLVALAGVGAAYADTLTIDVANPNYNNLVKDAALRSEGMSGSVPDSPWAEGNIGNSTYLGSHRMYPDVGYPNTRGPRRYLTQFDLSSIPSDATILSATMSLYFQRNSDQAPVINNYKLSRLQPGKAWVEGVGQYPATDGSVTWNCQVSYAAGNPSRVPWATPGATAAGGDIDDTTTITFNKAATNSEWRDFDVTSWVQAWVNGTWTNTGTVLWGGEGPGGNNQNYWQIVGKETTDSGNTNRPKLVVVYCPPGTSACASTVTPGGIQSATGYAEGKLYPKATIDLGSTDVSNHLTRDTEGDGHTTPTIIGGIECRRNLTASVDQFFYFDVDDNVIFDGNHPSVTITFTYYDNVGPDLSLNYDGALGEFYNNGVSVPRTGTNTWKTGSFVVTDAKFANRQWGNDFRISGCCADPQVAMYIDKVSVFVDDPDTVDYTIQNTGCTTINWTATETDVHGTATDHDWLSLNSVGGSLDSTLTAPVSATIDTTALTTPGLYTAYIKFGDGCTVTPASCLDEPFTYADGALNGNGGWSGIATASDIAIDASTVKYTGGAAFTYVLRDIGCGNPADSLITVSMKVKAGGGNEHTLWIADIADSAGNSFGRFYGTGTTARGRIGDLALVTGVSNLTGPGTWDTLTMKIYPAINKTMFYFNGVLMTDGVLDHTAGGAGDDIARAGLGRVNGSDSLTDYVYLDDLTVSVEPITLRRIDLTVVGCGADVQPPNGSGGFVVSGSAGTTTRSFTVTNNGAYEISDLAVTEIANSSPYGPTDYSWLTVSYPTDPIPPGGTAVVTATINLDDANLVTGTPAQASLNFYFCGGDHYNVPVLTVTRLLPVTYKYEMCEDLAVAQTNGSPAMNQALSGYGDDTTADPGYNKIGQGDDPNAVSARFVDTSTMSDNHSFSLRNLSTTTGSGGFTVDMRVWGEEEVDPAGGRSMSLAINDFNPDGGALQGRGVQIEPGSGTDDSLRITFASNAEVAGPFSIPDNPSNSSRFHMIRFVVLNKERTVIVYDLEDDLDPSPEGVNWNVIGVCTSIGDTHGVPYTDNDGLGAGIALNSHSGSGTTNSQWSADWVRIDAHNALGSTDPIIDGAECDGGLFADVDDDGDVDQADFAAFQLCFGRSWTTETDPCSRFDQDADAAGSNPDKDVDGFDRTAFENCASGPGVLADVCCDGVPKPGCP